MGRRGLWQFAATQKLREVKLYASHREPERTRAQDLPVIGIGQVHAIAAVAPSLDRAYGLFQHDFLAMRPASFDIDAADLTGNVIIMGGQSRNGATRKLLAEVELGIEQTNGTPGISGDRFRVRRANGSWSRWLGGIPVDGEVHEIKEDYGFIVRIANPWDGKQRRHLYCFRWRSYLRNCSSCSLLHQTMVEAIVVDPASPGGSGARDSS